ncbi:MAG: hypothetical protein ACI9YT_000983 [Halobacteriales archaeon]|jgi:hypothetical protein
MRRRTLLAACGTGLAGLTGCSSIPTTTGNTPDGHGPSASPSPTARSGSGPGSDGATSISLLKLQPALVTLASADQLGVSSDDRQYLFLEVSVTDGEAPPKEDLKYRFDGATYRPEHRTNRTYYWRLNEEWEYTAESGEGWLLYRLPASGDASGTGLTWPGGEWQAPESVRERLASPAPELSMTAEIPGTVRHYTKPTITLTATNEGDVDTRFVAAVNRTGWDIVRAPVGATSPIVRAGETRTVGIQDPTSIDYPGEENVDDGDPDLTYVVRWTGERISKDVRIVSQS